MVRIRVPRIECTAQRGVSTKTCPRNARETLRRRWGLVGMNWREQHSAGVAGMWKALGSAVSTKRGGKVERENGGEIHKRLNDEEN